MKKQDQEDKFHFDHRLETYKSMISISVEGFKYLALLNGGAAAGLVSGLAVLKASVGIGALRFAIACFAAGLIFNCIAYFFSYLTQYTLFNESVGRAKEDTHEYLVMTAAFCCAASLGCFAGGCFVIIVGIKGV